MSIVLKAENISKSFEGSKILEEISIAVKKGEFVAVMGPSGGGKSTLLYCISGMDKADGGEVFLLGKGLKGLSEKETEKLRLKHMGFVFQKANFLKNLSVEDNIMFPAFQAEKKKRKEIMTEVEKLMEQMGILETAKKDSRKISGGQLQRAAVCRALINHPDILFGDEPTGALNGGATTEVMDILGEINRQGTTVFLVTHDAKVAARADRILYLKDGRIKEEKMLGKYDEKEKRKREETVYQWLEKME